MSEPEQSTLLDLESKEINADWVDPNQPLKVPRNPLHWKAHELQLLLQILKKQASRNPAQFNSKNYIDTLTEYTKCIKAINDGKDEVLDEGGVDSPRTGSSETSPVGAGASVSVGAGISADNPLSR